jgi:hypothetical protein
VPFQERWRFYPLLPLPVITSAIERPLPTILSGLLILLRQPVALRLGIVGRSEDGSEKEDVGAFESAVAPEF